MNHSCYLSTHDNPFDPFEQFDSWFLFDVEKGHNCCSILARTANLSDDMTEVEVNAEVERAIDTIIEHDFTNTYKKITKPSLETNVEAQ